MYDLDAQRDALRSIRALADFGSGIKIAVLDGGVDLDHPDLVDQQMPAVSGAQSTLHGTAVASIIVGKTTGIAPRADAFQVPVFTEDQTGTLKGCSQLTLARAIKAACDQGARIINISGAHLSNSGHPTDEMRDAIEYCVTKDVQVVAAVGNDGLATDTLPASMQHVLAVGAHDIKGHAAPFNNSGPGLRNKTIFAPGVDISYTNQHATAKISGSSFAAPVVAGLCALVRAVAPSMSISDLQNLFFQSCVPCPLSHSGDNKPCAARRLDLVHLHERLSPLRANEVTPKQRISERNIPMSDHEQPMDLVTPAGEVEPAELAQTDVEPAAVSIPEAAGVTPAAAGLPASATVAPAAARTPRYSVQDPAANRHIHAPREDVQPQHYGSNLSAEDKVFAFGTISYDFMTETNMDYFQQAMTGLVAQNEKLNPLIPGNDVSMARFLAYRDASGFQPNMDKSTALVWTLKVDGIPVYAIRPQSQFAMLEFARLVQFMIEQTGIDPNKFVDTEQDSAGLMTAQTDAVDCPTKVDRVSIAGHIDGETRLYNGHVVPTLVPILRGMFSWNPAVLTKAVLGDKAKKAELESMRNFLDRIYYDLRNKGVDPADRAMNFAATNAHQAGEIFKDAVTNKLELNAIEVERSPVSRPGSDMYDVVMQFFNPQRREEEARKLYRYTIDVSGLMPVTFGPLRSWRAY